MASETQQDQYFCQTCGRYTLHARTLNLSADGCGFHLVNLIATIITGGFWLIGWIMLALVATSKNRVARMSEPYRCQACGSEH